MIQQARGALVKDSPLSTRLWMVCLMWKKFLGSRPDLSTYVEEWNRALFLTEAFLCIRNHLVASGKRLEEGRAHCSLKTVFNSGNGRLSELFSEWIIANDMTEDEIDAFLGKCREYFPLSASKESVTAHMAWEYFRLWGKDHNNLDQLAEGVGCLAQVPQPRVRHRLAGLAWNTFFTKAAKDSINLTEIRSPARLERELGFYESSSLRVFLAKLHDILKISMDACQGNEGDTKAKFYDDISFNIMGTPSLSHLLDHIANVKQGDEDIISIQYQFVTVSLMIWSFGLDDMKVNRALTHPVEPNNRTNKIESNNLNGK